MIEKEVNFRTFTCIQIVCPPHTFCPDEICILGDLPHTMNALPVLRPQRVFKKNSIRLAGKYWQPCNSLFHTEILRKHYRKIKSDCAQYPVHPPVHHRTSQRHQNLDHQLEPRPPTLHLAPHRRRNPRTNRPLPQPTPTTRITQRTNRSRH